MIAIALVWLAFFRGDPVTDGSAQPSVDVRRPVVSVAVGDIYNTVTLSGQVKADPAVKVKGDSGR